MQLTLGFAVQSHAGLRPNNEDAAFAGPRLLALADGMGGHSAGEIAAAIALRELVPLNESVNDKLSAENLLRDLREAALQANNAIAEHVANHPETVGMGTTLTALLFSGRRAALVHVGDSRAYLLRGGALRQLTRDDSFVQQLIDEGRISTEEAWGHPQRNLVTKVLAGREVEPHLDLFETEPGDRYLICSDGLSDHVPSEDIARILHLPDPRRCPQELIRTALHRGSSDNVTCITADLIEGPSGYNIAIGTGAAGDVVSVAGV